MAYLTEEQLTAMGFAHLGRNVRISDRASIYNPETISIGDNSRIDDFCVVSGRITIGRNVYIGPFALVAGGTPGIVFEDFSCLAYRVSVFSQSDDYSGATMSNPTVPAKYKREIKSPVRLGRQVIVGAGSTVCPGVDLADGTSVGAATLVLKSSEPWTILAGVPARVIKERRRDLLALEVNYLKDDRT